MAVTSSPAQSPGTIDTPPSDGGSWSFLDPVGGTTSYPPSSVSLLHSPASQHSLASFGVVVHRNLRHSSQNPSLSSLGLRSSHESMSLPMAPTSSPDGVIPAPGSRQAPTSSALAELARQHALFHTHQQAQQQTSPFSHPFPGPMGSPVSGSVSGTVGSSLDGSLGGSFGGSMGGPDDFTLFDSSLQEILLADQRFQELVPRASAISYPEALQSQQAQAQAQARQAQARHAQAQAQQAQAQQAQAQQAQAQQAQAQQAQAQQAQAQQAQTQQAQAQQAQAQRAHQAQQFASMLNLSDLLPPPTNNSPWGTMSVTDIQDDPVFIMDGYSQAALSSPNGSFASMSPGGGPAASPIVGSLSDDETNVFNAFVLQQQQQQQLQHLQQSQLYQLQQLPNMTQGQEQQEQQLHQLQQLLQFEPFQQLQAGHQLQQQHIEVSPLSQSASPPSSRPAQAAIPVAKSKASLARPVPYNLNKVRGSGVRVTKNKGQPGPSAADRGQLSTSAGSEDKFVVFTPKSITSQSGPGNRFTFEGVEATSATQKGRKGPLTEDAKLGALNVRRKGVPIDLVCWRFENFTGPLFPNFLREHFHPDAMSTFISENVASFLMNGIEQPCTVRLSLGPAFRSFFEIRGAKLFTPTPAADVQYHTTLRADDKGMHLDIMQTAPIGLDPEATASAGQQEKIRKACRAFTENIIKEDTYVQQLTYNPHTDLPGKIIGIVRRFYLRTKAPIVKTALSIYSMNFMMTHHLGLTRETVLNLAPLGVVPTDAPYVTARLLNRQIKAILDQFMKDEVDKLFKYFLPVLKAKSRTGWATCVAAFLVFCLFMEETGLAIDYFAVSENEADLEHYRDRKESNKRVSVVKLCRELENQPFRKFSYQFHKIYQTFQDGPGAGRASAAATASTDAPQNTTVPAATPSPTLGSGSSSKPRNAAPRPRPGGNAKAAFNPLVDDERLFADSLNEHDTELVMSLRELIKPDSESREELELLAFQPILDFVETHPYPRDVAANYKGRLVAKFLLSFQDENYIFTPAP